MYEPRWVCLKSSSLLCKQVHAAGLSSVCINNYWFGNMPVRLFVPVAVNGLQYWKSLSFFALKCRKLSSRESRKSHVNDWPKGEVCVYTAYPIISAFWTYLISIKGYDYKIIVVACVFGSKWSNSTLTAPSHSAKYRMWDPFSGPQFRLDLWFSVFVCFI